MYPIPARPLQSAFGLHFLTLVGICQAMPTSPEGLVAFATSLVVLRNEPILSISSITDRTPGSESLELPIYSRICYERNLACPAN